MNAFDLVVTVALGSILATMLLSKDVALAEGIVAFAVLIGLQFLIAWLSVRSRTISGLVKAEPRLLVFQGSSYTERCVANVWWRLRCWRQCGSKDGIARLRWRQSC